ncbi:protein-glutamate O-methyltransferase CheR [Desulfococcaceae bacterium HSG7]|nr:protein-glutamate O-methyltransferase CheR [Desulfococcaceae bacterium HSG9]MDM8555371.1 protein-glutamate O-methyltransferase CheR [Desulfococcaceae bacterium HSG7]
MELSQQEFELLRQYIYNLCGLAISDNKNYLIRQRLEPLVIKSGCSSFSEFYNELRKGDAGGNKILPQIEEKIINAITTHETSFFRDGHPFQAVKKFLLPQLSKTVIQRKSRSNYRKGAKVRLWSAGVATGQEPYSLAMLIHEFTSGAICLPGVVKEDFGLLATDISSTMISKAMTAEYSRFEIKRGLNAEYLRKFFFKEKKHWTIKNEIRTMVEFRQINLIEPFQMLGGFDVILCRNVLIYFDNLTKIRILEQFTDALCKNGWLILGATENIFNLSYTFRPVHFGETILYQKK